MRNNVVIIEDNFDDFEILKKYLNTKYEILPKIDTEEDFFRFRSLLLECFNGGTTQENSRQELLKEIASYEHVGVFVIDYVFGDTLSVGKEGIAFYEYFIQYNDSLEEKPPVLFVSKGFEIENSNLLKKHKNPVDKNSIIIIDSMQKIEGWENSDPFKRELYEKIENLIRRKEFQPMRKLIEIIKRMPQRVRKDSVRDKFTEIIDTIAEKENCDERIYNLLKKLSEQDVHITEKNMSLFIAEYKKL